MSLSTTRFDPDVQRPTSYDGGERTRGFWVGLIASTLLTLVVSALLVFAVEWIVRGSFSQTLSFFEQPTRPGWTTIILFALIIVFIDAIIGRSHHALFVLAPLTLGLAFVGHQKAHYLGDPLYPADFLYTRQIVELTPLLVRERPFTALGIVAGIILFSAAIFTLWRFWRSRTSRLSIRARCARLLVTAPALLFFASIMDYATFSWTRDRLQIIPAMWDQKENYANNGFAIAFALNMPMAKITAPTGYSDDAIHTIAAATPLAVARPDDMPDVIMVMSESFWDPTLLPNTSITPDPIPVVRQLTTGRVFSPEFGGTTANIEFEALTGFSNAFLPYGSIPYQQYVRKPVPSLASFFKSEGYDTRAFHPFAGWFWNRATVYKSFGFERFMSEEELPKLGKHGPLASDAAFVQEIMQEAESSSQPFFYFAVTLQNHGPYEANRYTDSSLAVDGQMSDASKASLKTYATGAADADKSLQALIEWASKRERHTVIAFFGDHLPPLGAVYPETGYMKGIVADRNAPLPELAAGHETPLVVWSNRTGATKDIGSVSPAFLPYYLLKTAGFDHPYYTGFLGSVLEDYKVVDRNMLVGKDGSATPQWARAKDIPVAVRDFRYLQYDMIFGNRHGEHDFFPGQEIKKPADTI